MAHKLYYCSNCKHLIKDSNGLLCKAFPNGVPKPYGHIPSPYYPDEKKEPEISIRKHQIFTAIQENNFIYEPVGQYKLDLGAEQEQDFRQYGWGGAINYLNDLYSVVESYIIPPSKTEIIDEEFSILDENYQVPSIDEVIAITLEFMDMQRIYTLTGKTRQEIVIWLKQWNRSEKAKYLLEMYAELEVEEWINLLEKEDIPSDFFLSTNFALRLLDYTHLFLKIGFTKPFKYIKELDLQHKQMKVLPQSIGNLTHLRQLDLTNNSLSDLPDEIEKLQELKRLDLYNNNLQKLPKSIYMLLNLERLDLYDNHIQYLSDSIQNLKKLKVLGLNHNNLQTLPKNISNLIDLEALFLTENQLKNFPSQICNLSKLKYLYLSGNQLKEIPPEISQLQNLRWLGVGRNQLTTLPKTLADLPHLEWLDISQNNLSLEEIEKIKKLLPNVEIVV